MWNTNTTSINYKHMLRSDVVSTVASWNPVPHSTHDSYSSSHFSFHIMQHLCLTDRCDKAVNCELRVWNLLVSDQLYCFQSFVLC
jgi:hypothetical protein